MAREIDEIHISRFDFSPGRPVPSVRTSLSINFSLSLQLFSLPCDVKKARKREREMRYFEASIAGKKKRERRI